MASQDQVPHPLRVLVVDDSRDTVESLAELLSIQGHAVREALSGDEALASVELECPDVVLLDIRMPGLNGLEVTRLIRERCAGGKQPLIVAITGCGTDADRLLTSGAGFDLHFVKPVDPAMLVGFLERFRRLLALPIPAEELLPLDGPPGGHPGAPMAWRGPSDAPGLHQLVYASFRRDRPRR